MGSEGVSTDMAGHLRNLLRNISGKATKAFTKKSFTTLQEKEEEAESTTAVNTEVSLFREGPFLHASSEKAIN